MFLVIGRERGKGNRTNRRKRDTEKRERDLV
jgi:hypothetical protein